MVRYLQYLILSLLLLLFPVMAYGQEATSQTTKQPLNIEILPKDIPTSMASQMAEKKVESLFYRAPWPFGFKTFEKVGHDIKEIPENITYFYNNISSYNWKEWKYWLLFFAFLMLAILGVILNRRFEQWTDQIREQLPQNWSSSLKHILFLLLQLLKRAGPVLAILFIFYIIWGSFSQSKLIAITVQLGWILLIYLMGIALIQEFLVNEREALLRQMPETVGLRLSRLLSYLLLFVSVCYSVIFAFQEIGYYPEFIAFLYFCLNFVLLGFALYLASHKKDILYIFPDIDDAIYQKFLSLFAQFYFYAILFTLILGGLHLVGYQNLASMLFLRSWAIIAVILLTALLYRLAKKIIQHYASPDRQTITPFYQHVLKFIAIGDAILLAYVVLNLLGIYQELMLVLNFPIVVIGKIQLNLLSLIKAVFFFVLFLMGARLVISFLEENIYPRLKYDVSLIYVINKAVHYFLIALGILTALSALGLDLSMFAIFAGALGVGIGFGLQGIAKNFISGFVLIFGRLIKKGDFVTVGDDTTGYIQEIGWRLVHLRTTDNVDLIVPSSSFIDATIINWTHVDNHVRVHVPVGVSYNSDVETVRHALLEAADEHPEVLRKPIPLVWLKEFGDNSVNFELLVWIDQRTINKDRLIGEINFNIWYALQRHGIEIPFPQRDIHIKSGIPWEQLSHRPDSPLSSD